MQIPVCFNGRLMDSMVCLWQVIKMMSWSFGGTRIWPELGTYINRAGYLVFNLNIWIQSQMDEKKFRESRAKLLALACQIRDKLHQESIVIELDGYLEFH